MDSNSFGKVLREERLKAGYGLRRFAEAIGLRPSILCKIEHGRILPHLDKEILLRILVCVPDFEQRSGRIAYVR